MRCLVVNCCVSSEIQEFRKREEKRGHHATRNRERESERKREIEIDRDGDVDDDERLKKNRSGEKIR